ncbi:MAG: AraC family transcriptional regulator [Spirochaetota bacterium]
MSMYYIETPCPSFPRLTHFGYEAHAIPYTFPHYHHGYEIMYFTSGSSSIELIEGSPSVSVSGEQVLIISPRIEHRFLVNAKKLSYYWLGIQTSRRIAVGDGPAAVIHPRYKIGLGRILKTRFVEHIDSSLENIARGLTLKDYAVIAAPPQIGCILHDMRSEIENKGLLFQEIVAAKTVEMMALIARSFSAPPADVDAITRIQQHLAAHHTPPPPLSELAGIIGRHPVYLSKRFRSVTGMTITDYANQQRINSAKRLLVSGESVGDTAAKLGFASIYYFSTLFKKYCGKPPSSFRRIRERH